MGSTSAASCRWGWVGRSRGSLGSVRSIGASSTASCTARATRATASSSMRTAVSRGPMRRSSKGFSSPATSSGPTAIDMTDALSIDGLNAPDIAKTIDHSLLRPELDDAFVEAGCRLAAEYDVASVCVRPADVRRAVAILDGSSVAVGTTIGFPHGNHLTVTKVFESVRAIGDGARELDIVLQIGALKSGRDAEVEDDIAAVV